MLYGLLMQHLGGDVLHLSSDVTGFVSSDDRVEVTLRDGRRMTADALIGADGVGSIVRRQLHPGEPPPRESGLLSIRGVAHNVADRLGDITGAQYFGRGFEAGIARAGACAIYWFMSLRADDVGDAGNDAAQLSERASARLHGPMQETVRATPREDMRIDRPRARPADGVGRRPRDAPGDAPHPMLPHAGQGARR